VLVDLTVAVVNVVVFILTAMLIPTFDGDKQENPGFCWMAGHVLLASFSLADCVLSLYVMDYVRKQNVVGLLDTLYTNQCFGRLNDKVIIEASGAVEEYVEVVVIIQACLASIMACFHVVKACGRTIVIKICPEGCWDCLKSMAPEVIGEAIELFTSVFGYVKFMSALAKFRRMHELMNKNADQLNAAGSQSSSEACIYSCCTGVQDFELPKGESREWWRVGSGGGLGSLPDTNVIIAFFAAMSGMIGLCLIMKKKEYLRHENSEVGQSASPEEVPGPPVRPRLKARVRARCSVKTRT
jgi:hypothetical protein